MPSKIQTILMIQVGLHHCRCNNGVLLQLEIPKMPKPKNLLGRRCVKNYNLTEG